MAPSALDFLEVLQNEVPAAAEDIAELASFYQRKLWHQITVKIDSIFKQEGPLNSGDVPVRFFTSFIVDFAHKINLLKFSQFAVHATKSLPTPAASTEFLQSAISKLEDMKLAQAKEPILFLRMHVAQHNIEMVRERSLGGVHACFPCAHTMGHASVFVAQTLQLPRAVCCCCPAALGGLGCNPCMFIQA